MEEIITYKCPNCASNLSFNVESNGWKCEYCDSSYSKQRLEELCEITEKQFINTNCYRCKGCGAKLITNDAIISEKCAYCGNNLIIKDKLINTLKPDKIMPFKVSYEEARKIALKKIGSKSGLSNIEITGVYVPYWLYDFYSYVELDNSQASYRYIMNFSQVPIDASVKIDDQLACAIEPFDYKELIDFSPVYLAGFLAERYTDKTYESFDKVMMRMNIDIPFILKRVYNVKLAEEDISVENKKSEKKYVLLPIWIVNYSVNGMIHKCYINGQTRKCVNDDEFNNATVDQDIYKQNFYTESNLEKLVKGIVLIILIGIFSIIVVGGIRSVIYYREVIWRFFTEMTSVAILMLVIGVLFYGSIYLCCKYINSNMFNGEKDKAENISNKKYMRTGRYVVDVGRAKK